MDEQLNKAVKTAMKYPRATHFPLSAFWVQAQAAWFNVYLLNTTQ